MNADQLESERIKALEEIREARAKVFVKTSDYLNNQHLVKKIKEKIFLTHQELAQKKKELGPNTVSTEKEETD